MKFIKFSVVYALGLALILPLMVLASKEDITWLFFLSPVLVVLVAEALTFRLRLDTFRLRSRIGGLVLSLALVGAVGKWWQGEEAMQPIGMAVGLWTIYQFPVIMVFSRWTRKRGRSVPK